MTGSRDAVARARALIVRDVRSKDAWFTTAKEAQKLEDELAAIEQEGAVDPSRLRHVDEALLALTVPEEEWEVLYRRRLQLVAGDGADLPDSPTAHPARPAASSAAPPQPAFRLDLGSVIGLATSVLVVVDLVVAALRGDRKGLRRR